MVDLGQAPLVEVEKNLVDQMSKPVFLGHVGRQTTGPVVEKLIKDLLLLSSIALSRQGESERWARQPGHWRGMSSVSSQVKMRNDL